MDTTGLTMVRQGMRVVGVIVGREQFQRDFLQEAVNGEPAELVRALVPMEDVQASFQILRLSATSRLSHLLRTVIILRKLYFSPDIFHPKRVYVVPCVLPVNRLNHTQ